jgi:hypothetical protein
MILAYHASWSTLKSLRASAVPGNESFPIFAKDIRLVNF